MKVLKKKMQREGIFRELKRKRYYEKPSEARAREKGEAVRRARKLARKQAQRDRAVPACGRACGRGARPRPSRGRGPRTASRSSACASAHGRCPHAASSS